MRGRHLSLLLLPVLLIPGTALAHSAIPGIGNFYNGVLHPVLVPAHLLLVIATGLFLGQHGLQRAQLALGVFMASTLLGLAVAWFMAGGWMEMLVLVLAASVGLLIAIRPRMAIHWYMLVTLLAGFSLGMDSTQEELVGGGKLVALLGTGVAICLLVLYPIIFAEYCNKKDWQKIGIRILGSWIAASSLLVLTLSFATRA